MENDDITVRVLIEIRDRLDQTNQRLDQTREELGAHIDQTNQRLDQTREELGARIDQTNQRLGQSEIRLATAITGLAGTLTDVKQLLVQRNDLDDRVTRCEADIRDLKQRA